MVLLPLVALGLGTYIGQWPVNTWGDARSNHAQPNITPGNKAQPHTTTNPQKAGNPQPSTEPTGPQPNPSKREEQVSPPPKEASNRTTFKPHTEPDPNATNDDERKDAVQDNPNSPPKVDDDKEQPSHTRTTAKDKRDELLRQARAASAQGDQDQAIAKAKASMAYGGGGAAVRLLAIAYDKKGDRINAARYYNQILRGMCHPPDVKFADVIRAKIIKLGGQPAC
ncbi:MAG: hypothetical protein AAFX99_16060, partial [Myxococcota bacterium]